MIDLAVVIVTWNSARDIGDALRSLLADLAASALTHEVWVVDAASDDDTVAIVRGFEAVRLIASERNLGFGASNNLALRAMGFRAGASGADSPRAVLLLNPDTITHGGACQTMYDALNAAEDVGVVGARLSYGDGGFQHSAFRFPGLRQIWCELFPAPGRWLEGAFNGRYPRAKYDGCQAFDIDFPLGAAMTLKRDAILETGLFDEDFFLYCEEIDWAWRIKNRGWRILCAPCAHVTHLAGRSASQARPGSLVHLWRSRLHLYQKHHPVWKRWLTRRLLAWGMRRRKRRLGADEAELRDACQQIIDMANA